MPPFLEILSQVLILFSLIVTGFSALKLKIITSSAVPNLISLILKITLPAMILDSMVNQAYSPQVLAASGSVLLISFAVYAVLILLAIPLGSALHCPPEDRGVYRFVLSFSNVGFMGFPVVQAVFGKEALFYTAIYNLPFNLLSFTLGVIMLLRGHSGPAFRLDWRHFTSPVLVSIVIGFLVFLTGLHPPTVVSQILALTGSVTTPLSMILVGALLAQNRFRETFGQWRLYVVSALRLVVWPLVVYFALRLFVADPLLAAIPALITAMPAAANTALLATEHGANAKLASRAVFLSTLLSIVTLPLVAVLVRS